MTATTPPRESLGEDPAVDARAARRGRLLVLVAALLWSTSGLFARAPLFADWPAAERGMLLAFWRAAFAGVLLLPAVRRPTLSMRLIPATLVFAGMNVAYLSAVSLTTAANAIWLQSTAPFWVIAASWLWWRHPFVGRQRAALVLITAGMAVILGFESRGQSTAGVTCGVVSGVFYAGVILSLRWLRELGTVWLVAINHLVAAAVLLPFVWMSDQWPSAAQLDVLAAFGLVQMAVPYLLFARGLRYVSAQEAAMIALVEPVVMPVWVYLAWGERPALWTIAGAALILVGLVVRFRAVRVSGVKT
jgi:drug/metabolite transporter (DMT)-like permease